MKVVVDATVFLAFVIPEEERHGEALRFLALSEIQGHCLHFPAIAIAEVAGGVARRKRDPAKADLAVSRLLAIPKVTIVPQSLDAARLAASLAGRHFLRGADAVYCQLAKHLNAPLVTLDREILERIPAGVAVFSPEDWITAQDLA